MNKRIIVNIAGLLLLMVIAASLGIYTANRQAMTTSNPAPLQEMLWPKPKVIKPFSVIDHNLQEFNQEQLLSKWSFMFFGYTHCPDICPITLALMNQVQEKLAAMDADKQIQTLFVTVDPERDNSEKLAQYVGYFNADFIGLGGSQKQIEQFTQQLGIPYYLNKADGSEDYLVDHSGSLFLVDPNGRLVAIFSAPHIEADIVKKFLEVKQFIEAQS